MIKKPTLVIDKARCVRNIQLMANKALRNDLIFRPHFKTHQSAVVAEWFRDAGVTKATVSSVSMAKFFADQGWNDITIAFPVNILEIEEINLLAERIHLNLLVESIDSVSFLKKELKFPVGIFIEIDAGYERSGINAHNLKVIDDILGEISCSSGMSFMGFLTHAGHSYKARSHKEINDIYHDSSSILQPLKEQYHKTYPELILSYGDTPTASVVNDFSNIDELRPGNFVYYDITQWQISSCELKDISVAIECPIVAIHKERNELIIYGGGVHFSKDRCQIKGTGTIYGIPVYHDKQGWSNPINDAYLTKISQEHGTIKLPLEELSKFKLGDTIKVLPVHSCMAADLLKENTIVI